MKKILMTLMASMLLLSSTTYAQDAVTHNTSFSKKDAQALFGTHKVKTTTLNNGEMAKTEGEWFWLVLGALVVGWASRTPADAPELGKPLPGQHGNPASHLPFNPYGKPVGPR